MLPGMSTKEDASKVKSGNTGDFFSQKTPPLWKIVGGEWFAKPYYHWISRGKKEGCCLLTIWFGFRLWDFFWWNEWVCFYWILPNHCEIYVGKYILFVSPFGRIGYSWAQWKTGNVKEMIIETLVKNPSLFTGWTLGMNCGYLWHYDYVIYIYIYTRIQAYVFS